MGRGRRAPEARSATLTSRRRAMSFAYRLAKGSNEYGSHAPPVSGSGSWIGFAKSPDAWSGMPCRTPSVPTFVPARQTGRGVLSRAKRSLAPPTSHLPGGRAPRHTNARSFRNTLRSVVPVTGQSPTHGTHTRAVAGPVPVGAPRVRARRKRRRYADLPRRDAEEQEPAFETRGNEIVRTVTTYWNRDAPGLVGGTSGWRGRRATMAPLISSDGIERSRV